MLRNIIGPLFNFNLAHFLTLEFCYLFIFFLAETPIFIVFSAKNAKLKETQKRNKDTICEHNCANSFCQNVRFCAFFIFAVFPVSIFSEMFFDWFPKIKKQQNSKARRTKKQQQPENKMQSKKTWNIMIQNNTRQQAEKKKKNKNKRTSWNKKANTTKRKSKNQKENMKNRKEGRKKRTRERQRKRERQKQEKVKQG